MNSSNVCLKGLLIECQWVVLLIQQVAVRQHIKNSNQFRYKGLLTIFLQNNKILFNHFNINFKLSAETNILLTSIDTLDYKNNRQSTRG